MTNEQIESKAKETPTIELANWLQDLVEEKRLLKGGRTGHPHKIERVQAIQRYIRIIAPELSKRQFRMEGF